MAYWRLIQKGSFGALETWSVGFTYAIFGLAPDTPDQAAADGILARLLTYSIATNFPSGLKGGMSTQCTFDGWRVELRSETEHLLSVAEGKMTTAVPGTGTAIKSPQDAVVVSFRTSTPGARGRGRVYWPALAAQLSSSYTLASPTTTQYATDTKTWLNAIGSQVNAYYASISSVLTVVLSVRSGTDHVCRNVNNLQVGSVMDTQRRRRDNLLETYATVAYP